MGGRRYHAQLRSVTKHVHIVAVTLEPRLGTAIPAMHRRGTGMPLGDREGTLHRADTPQSPIATCWYALRRLSGTLPPETVKTDPNGIYDTRGEPARQSSGPIEIAEMGPRPLNEPVVRVPFDRGQDGSGGGGQQGQQGQRGQTRISRSWMRRPRPRRKYIMHEQIPTPRVGQSCGAIPSPQTTPISGPFPGDCGTWAYVSGPLAGDIGRGPDTRAHGPGGTPPNSQGKSALTRCVVGWVESGYVKRGAHDTRHLSSCLVTPTSISGLIAGSRGGR